MDTVNSCTYRAHLGNVYSFSSIFRLQKRRNRLRWQESLGPRRMRNYPLTCREGSFDTRVPGVGGQHISQQFVIRLFRVYSLSPYNAFAYYRNQIYFPYSSRAHNKSLAMCILGCAAKMLSFHCQQRVCDFWAGRGFSRSRQQIPSKIDLT